jgi:CBS domain-containing protein
MKVKDILEKKGPEVVTISGDKTLQDALRLLVTNKIGVLIVIDHEAKLTGIISERDILNACHSQPVDYRDLNVNDFMTRNVIIVEPEDSIDYVENIMTKNRFRHVPVIKNKVLVGLISIGDIVKEQLHETKEENKYLKDYISGTV